MPFYRKKPVVIEAMQFDGSPQSAMVIVDWMQVVGGVEPSHRAPSYRPGIETLFIYTLEGVMEASAGDYVIRGVQGEFYPCKPDIFAKTYEEV